MEDVVIDMRGKKFRTRGELIKFVSNQLLQKLAERKIDMTDSKINLKEYVPEYQIIYEISENLGRKKFKKES
jgi:hypothetical protein